MDEQKTKAFLLAEFSESWNQIRHHEQQRAKLLEPFIILTGGFAAFVAAMYPTVVERSLRELALATLPLFLLFVIMGWVLLCMCLKLRLETVKHFRAINEVRRFYSDNFEEIAPYLVFPTSGWPRHLKPTSMTTFTVLFIVFVDCLAFTGFVTALCVLLTQLCPTHLAIAMLGAFGMLFALQISIVMRVTSRWDREAHSK